MYVLKFIVIKIWPQSLKEFRSFLSKQGIRFCEQLKQKKIQKCASKEYKCAGNKCGVHYGDMIPVPNIF